MVRTHKKKHRWVLKNRSLRCWGESNQHTCKIGISANLNTQMRRATSRQHALDILLEFCLVAFGGDAAVFYERQDNELVYMAGNGLSGLPPSRCPVSGSHILSQALDSSQVISLAITHSGCPDEKRCDLCNFFADQGMHSLLVASLRTTETPVGVLIVGLRSEKHFNVHHEHLLDAFSEAAGNTLHRFIVTDQLKKAISNRDRELQMLYDLTAISAETPDRIQLVRNSLQRILKAVDCSSGVIHLIDEEDYELKLACAENFPEEYLYYMSLSGAALQLWQRVFQEQKMVYLRHIPDHPPFPDVAIRLRKYHSYLGVPIRIKSRQIGVLSFFGNSRLLSDSISEQLAHSAADELGQSIESISLRKQVEDAAISQERQRLSRNLHDSVSQSLYALVLSADVSSKLLRIKDYAGLHQELDDIGKVALQCLKEMRLMLFDFRPSSLEREGLEVAIRSRLNSVECRAGIHTTVEIDDTIGLSLETEGEIYRIVIEALNNSLKHASATEVRVTLCTQDRQFVLEVEDNGCGFDLANNQKNGGIGLKSMHERARVLRGDLLVSSAPDHGTLIKLVAPLSRKL